MTTKHGSKEYWQALSDVHAKAPSIREGLKVEIVAGRKHKGLKGTVERVMPSKFGFPFRYKSGASLDLAHMRKREGYCALVKPDTGPSVWVACEYLMPEGFTFEEMRAGLWIR